MLKEPRHARNRIQKRLGKRLLTNDTLSAWALCLRLPYSLRPPSALLVRLLSVIEN